MDGLNMVLRDHFGEEIEELFEETDFQEEPRRLDEILAADTELFDRTYTKPGQLWPYTDFEIGMLNGEMSALRWVLGSEGTFSTLIRRP